MNLIKSVVLINILKLCVAFDNEYDDYLNNMDYSNIDINRIIYETDISDLKVKLKSVDKIYVSEIDEDALDKICQLDLLIVRTSENDVIYCRDIRKYRTKRDSQDDEGSGDLEMGSGMDEGEMEDVKELTTVSGDDAHEETETLDNNETKEYGASVEPPLANNDDKEGEMPTMASRFGENTDNEATDDEVIKEQDTNITNINENVTPSPIAEPPEPSTTITSSDNEGMHTSEADQETQHTDESTEISTQSPSNENPEDTTNGDKDINLTTMQSIDEILKHIEREADDASESHTTARSRSIIPAPGDVSPDSVDGKSSSDSSNKVEETLLVAGNQSDKNTTGDTRSVAAPANAGSISGLNVLIIIVVLVAMAGVAAFGYSKYQKRKVQYNVVNAEEEGKEMKEIKRYENVAIKDVSEGKPLVDGDVVCIEMEKPHTPSPTPRTFTVTPIPIKKANNEDEDNNREDEGANDIHTDNVNKTP